MTVMTISEKGWVVIPKALRQKYALEPGTGVQIVDYGGVLAIVPLPDDPVLALKGLLLGGESLTAVLLQERAVAKSEEDGRGA
jgi:AbrB family looped-hinge helix DNA binding protein